MSSTLRAVRALILLAGFQLLSLVLLGVLAAVDWAAVHAPSSVTSKVWLVSVVLAVPVIRGMFMLRLPKLEEPPGVPLTEEAEPRLWAVVRELAEAAGTRAPDTIILTADVNASVMEHPRLGGLLPGRRSLSIGLPLLTGLSEAQFRSVLAHEYGHYVGGDTRLGPVVARGRRQIQRTIAHFHEKADKKVAQERAEQEKKSARRVAKGKKAKEIDTTGAGATYRAMAKIYTWYGKFFLRASLSTGRGQELAADRNAARLAGRDATASALREIPVLANAYDFYLECYATLGLDARTMPPQGAFFGGFGDMLSARELQLAEMRAELPEPERSPYDSHPPIAERVRAVESLPDDGRADDGRGAALDILGDARGAAAALEPAVLADELLGFRRAADWSDVLDSGMAARLSELDTPLHRALAFYTKEAPTLPALLQVIDEGHLWQLARRLPLSDEASAAQGRAFREFVRSPLEGILRTWVISELSNQGLLSWEFSWSESATVILPGDPETAADALDAAVTAALADLPDTAPLRALLPPAPAGNGTGTGTDIESV
ncbi:M48 family metallopeptidase [Streptomyces abyssomicinicus]|uniref:M48 family metallopeptidase n=1 Tax=Streptomyces abyssomicinicus TaxID=574929 RepID=UPI0012508810|nr:M48 family metallopeptidase [Streptomyces abyssomicinicus]